jgi:hypothetical protein
VLPDQHLERFVAFTLGEFEKAAGTGEQNLLDFTEQDLLALSDRAWQVFPIWTSGQSTEIVSCLVFFKNPFGDHNLGIDTLLAVLEEMRRIESDVTYAKSDVRPEDRGTFEINGSDVNRLHERVRKRLYRSKKKCPIVSDAIVQSAINNQTALDIVVAVQDALIDMPNELREVATLRFLAGMSIKSIARKLERSVGTINSNIERVRKRLEIWLVEYNKCT